MKIKPSSGTLLSPKETEANLLQCGLLQNNVCFQDFMQNLRFVRLPVFLFLTTSFRFIHHLHSFRRIRV